MGGRGAGLMASGAVQGCAALRPRPQALGPRGCPRARLPCLAPGCATASWGLAEWAPLLSALPCSATRHPPVCGLACWRGCHTIQLLIRAFPSWSGSGSSLLGMRGSPTTKASCTWISPTRGQQVGTAVVLLCAPRELAGPRATNC
jgi:hypothetical protein